MAPGAVPADRASGAGYTNANQASGGGNVDATTAMLQERLVIMDASLTIVVADPQAKIDEILALADEMGGFVVTMNVYQTYNSSGELNPEGTISIRVPAQLLDSALTRIKANVIEVSNEIRSGQDVTQQYVDLESQLRNLEAAEAELTAIMEEATDPQDVLDVFNQLEYYRQQIELVRGQMQYFEQAAAYSLITVTVTAQEIVQPIQVGPWSPRGALNEAIQDLIHFMQGFVDFVIRFVLYVLPVLLVIFGPIALVAWAIVAGIKRSLRKHKAQAKS